MSIKVIDKGWNRILKQLKQADNAHVKVGILQKAGNYSADDGNSTIAQVATKNEFGSKDGRTPARPFMRLSFDLNKQLINTLKKKLYSNVLSGKYSMKKALSLLGEAHKGQVQATILKSSLFKSNAPMTEAIKRKKGRSKGAIKPLIDTGMMREKISYEVKI